MHKSSIFGFTLIAMLFLAATTAGMSMQVLADKDKDDEKYSESLYNEKSNSYEDFYDDKYGNSYDEYYDDDYGDSYGDYSKYPTKDKKFVCKYGPFEGFFVVDPKFCKIKPPPTPEGDAELQCEECIKYWLHTLQGAGTGFINDLAYFINSINYNFPSLANNPVAGCTPVGAGTPNPAATCLPIAASNQEGDLAQVYEICEQLELAIEWIAEQDNISLEAAFVIFRDGPHPSAEQPNGDPETGFVGYTQSPETAEGLLECYETRVLPLLDEEVQQPTPAHIQQPIEQESQMTDSVQQQSTQQKSTQLGIKQLLKSLR